MVFRELLCVADRFDEQLIEAVTADIGRLVFWIVPDPAWTSGPVGDLATAGSRPAFCSLTGSGQHRYSLPHRLLVAGFRECGSPRLLEEMVSVPVDPNPRNGERQLPIAEQPMAAVIYAMNWLALDKEWSQWELERAVEWPRATPRRLAEALDDIDPEGQVLDCLAQRIGDLVVYAELEPGGDATPCRPDGTCLVALVPDECALPSEVTTLGYRPLFSLRQAKAWVLEAESRRGQSLSTDERVDLLLAQAGAT